MTAHNILPPILYEDAYCVVLHKPSGLYSIPDRKQVEPNVKDMLIAKYGLIYTVHRLDAGTSGVIIFAKDEATHKQLSAQFEERLTQKIYIGIVQGIPQIKTGTIQVPILEHPGKNGTMVVHHKGKEAITNYTVLQELRRYSVLQFEILTGRTHQIRVHCKDMGHPIVADNLYGDAAGVYLSKIKKKFNLSKKEDEEKPLLGRLALHAAKLSIQVHNTHHTFEAPLPKDMAIAIKQLEKYC